MSERAASISYSVDGKQVAIGHVIEHGPRHDLEQVPVHRINSWEGKKAIRVRGRRRARRMQVIQVRAVPHDLQELLERVAAFRQPDRLDSKRGS